MKISEVFQSLQGEGKYSGYPMLFIRTSGCSRRCSFCDSSYHIHGKEMSIDDLVKRINKSKLKIVCWTGGEPLLQIKEIKEVIKNSRQKEHHLETNGDLLEEIPELLFNHIVVSPKEKKIAQRVRNSIIYEEENIEIKIVTDLDKIGMDMLKYADCLMPLTTYNKKKDLEIYKKVWDYCVKHQLRFSPRLQTVFGKRKGI